jgi:hypothetical protein
VRLPPRAVGGARAPCYRPPMATASASAPRAPGTIGSWIVLAIAVAAKVALAREVALWLLRIASVSAIGSYGQPISVRPPPSLFSILLVPLLFGLAGGLFGLITSVCQRLVLTPAPRGWIASSAVAPLITGMLGAFALMLLLRLDLPLSRGDRLLIGFVLLAAAEGAALAAVQRSMLRDHPREG